jgi:hypothetical protein
VLRRLLPAFAVLLFLAPASAYSQEPPPGDDWGNEGDDDFSFGEDTKIPTEPPPSNWSLGGFVRSDLALWAERLDDKPLAKARQSLDLKLSYRTGIFRMLLAGHAEYDAAYLIDRDDYDSATIETYEWDGESRELIAALSPGDFEITVGRQIVAWGEGDALSVLDVVNPRDLREPGLADLDDLRLPILATRIGWFPGSHRIEAMVIHESNFGKRPPPLGFFSPLPSLLAEAPPPNILGTRVNIMNILASKEFDYADKQSRFAWDQQQFLLRWVYKGSGFDLGLYGAYVADQTGVIALPDISTLINEIDIDIILDHPLFWVTGTSGAFVWDSWLFKWEIAAELERHINVGEGKTFPPVIESETSNLIGGVLGVTWTGISNLSVSLEASKRWFFDKPDNLLLDLHEPFITVRARYRMLRERLTLQAASLFFGLQAQMGWLARVEATYELADGLKLGLGYISYQPGDEFGPVRGLDEHDRVFAQLRWDFQVF